MKSSGKIWWGFFFQIGLENLLEIPIDKVYPLNLILTPLLPVNLNGTVRSAAGAVEAAAVAHDVVRVHRRRTAEDGHLQQPRGPRVAGGGWQMALQDGGRGISEVQIRKEELQP